MSSGYKECRSCGAVNPENLSLCLQCGGALKRGGGGKWLLLVGVGVLVTAITAAGVYYVLLLLDKGTPPIAGGESSVAGGAPVEARALQVGDLTVMDPCGFQPAPDYDLGEMAQYVADQDVRFCQQGDLFLALSLVRYNPDVVTDLDGAVEGSIREMGANPDVENLSCDTESFVLDGHPARRTVCGFHAPSMNAEANTTIVYTSSANDLYMLQAVFPQDAVRYLPVVQRIMSSVRYVEAR